MEEEERGVDMEIRLREDSLWCTTLVHDLISIQPREYDDFHHISPAKNMTTVIQEGSWRGLKCG